MELLFHQAHLESKLEEAVAKRGLKETALVHYLCMYFNSCEEVMDPMTSILLGVCEFTEEIKMLKQPRNDLILIEG